MRHFKKRVPPPIRLSIAGNGTVLRLDRWTIRLVIAALTAHNTRGSLRARMAFPWISNSISGENSWERLLARGKVSNSELERIQRQLNATIIQENLVLTPLVGELVESFAPSRNQLGSRRATWLPWNGLAFEVSHIDCKRLLQAPVGTLVVTRLVDYGGFHVWRFRGTCLTGELSSRTLTAQFANFYDHTRIWNLPCRDVGKQNWFEVKSICSLEGFCIDDRPIDLYKRKSPGLSRRPVRSHFAMDLPETTELRDFWFRLSRDVLNKRAIAAEAAKPRYLLEYVDPQCDQSPYDEDNAWDDAEGDESETADWLLEDREREDAEELDPPPPPKGNQPFNTTKSTELLDMDSFDL